MNCYIWTYFNKFCNFVYFCNVNNLFFFLKLKKEKFDDWLIKRIYKI